MMMTCQKCGLQCERGSGAQKFCYTCSPHKRQLSGGLSKITCAKCGEVVQPNSARQKWCRKCSRHIVKHENRLDLTCCRCGKPYAKANYNQKYHLNEMPCADCNAIVKRQQNAEQRKWRRFHNRRMSRFGKWLLILEEEAVEKNKTGSYYCEHLWTRMRYVSQQEIDGFVEANRRNRSWFLGRALEQDECIGYRLNWEICTDTGGHDGYVTGPGYYRVEPLQIDVNNPTRLPQLRTACSGGIPNNWNNATLQLINRRLIERANAHRGKARMAKWLRDQRERIRKERESSKEYAKREWAKSKQDQASRQFFGALAMAGAVSERVTTTATRQR